MNYISTCQPPTSVTASVSGCFGEEEKIYLAVAKFNLLELFLVSETGLEPVIHTNVYGKITNLGSFRLKKEKNDSLILLTESLDISILQYDSVKNAFITKCSGNFNDRLRRSDLKGPILRIDPTNSFALVHFYPGMLKIISLDYRRRGVINMYNVRLNELHIIDICFLPQKSLSSLHISLIFKDRLSCNFRSYLLRLEDMELKNGPLGVPAIDEQASIILASSSQHHHAVLVGLDTVVVIDSNGAVNLTPSAFIGKEPIYLSVQVSHSDNPAFVLADYDGNLYLLSISKNIVVSYLGSTTFASTLTYLDKGILFIGSSLSDSQLIRINKTPVDNSYITILESYINIGPIIDMEIFDRQKQDIPRLITCSGVDQWGSLRVLSNGIQINILASLQIKEYSSVFSLKLRMPGDGFDDALLFSDYKSSLIVTEEDGNFHNLSRECFCYSSQTIFAGNVVFSQVLQVCLSQIRLIDLKKMTCEFSLEMTDEPIECCSCNGWQFVIASGNKVSLFDITSGYFRSVSSHDFSYSVSCLSLYALNFNSNIPNGFGPATLLGIGFYERSCLEVYTLPDFSLINTQNFDTKIFLCSILFIEFKPNAVFLLAGTGTGDLFVYELSRDVPYLTTRTKSHLGTSSLFLCPFRVKGLSNFHPLLPGCDETSQFPPLGEVSILSCSNRSSIIHYNVFNLGYSCTSKQQISCCCPFNSRKYSNCLLTISNQDVSLCQISDICSNSIQTIPIYESPRKICYQAENSVFGLITVRTNSEELHQSYLAQSRTHRPFSLRTEASLKQPILSSREVSNLIVVNQDTLDPICVHTFPDTEIACSITSCKLSDHSYPLFAAGTGIVSEPNSEPSSGRVVLFHYCDNELCFVADYIAQGAIFGLVENNGRLICCVNHSIIVLSLRSDNELICLLETGSHVTSICCKALNDTLIIGDLIRSLSVYHVNEDSDLSLSGKSAETNWLTAIEIVDSNTFLYANMEGSLFIVTLPTDRETDNNTPANLEVKLCYNLDQQINVFKRGSLSYGTTLENNIKNKHSILFGSVSGMIGLLLDVPQEWEKILASLQSEFLKQLRSIGDFDHETWRTYQCTRFKSPKTLIDGDVLEGFINIHVSQLKEIVASVDNIQEDELLEKKVDTVTSYIGDLMRYH